MKITSFIFATLLVCTHVQAIELRAVQQDRTKPATSNLLKNHLDLVSFRHKILAENIANLNTPGYKANEITMPTTLEELANVERGHRKITLKTTSVRHLQGRYSSSNKYSSHKLKDPLEVKQNGNNVSMAQQVNKLSQNQSSYDMGLKISASTNSLISTILGK